MFGFILVDRFQIRFEVSHQTTHHTARKSRTDQQRVHQTVLWADIQAKEVIHKFLNQRTHFHVGFHIDFRYLISGIFQHSLYAEKIGVSRTP